MSKSEVREGISKKHIFQSIFDAKNQGPDLVKNEFGMWAVPIEEVGVVKKFDEQWMPKWSQIETEPLGAHGQVFWDFVRFWKDVFTDEFWVRQKVG